MKVFKNPTLIPTAIVFIAVMLVVLISFLLSRNNANQELDTTVEAYTQSAQSAVQDRLNIFEETLRAGLGLFAGNGVVTKQQWHQFISTSAVLERYAGAQTVAYAKVVPRQNLDQFLAIARTDITPQYTIIPAGDRSVYAPLIYIEPDTETSQRSLGFDGLSESVRAKAMTAARDTNKITITNKVQSQRTPGSEGRAFIMYAPQYRLGMPLETAEQRQAAIEGYLLVGFLVNRLMENVIPNQSSAAIGFSMTLGSDNEPVYKSTNYEKITSGRTPQHQTSTLKTGNTTIRFDFVYNLSDVVPAVSSRPLAVLLFGTITAMLIAGAVWLVLRGKAHELLLDKERGINEAKDNLLSLASHQLRTPATGVKQYLGLVLQGFSGDITQQQQELLSKAYASNERQLKTINDVLYLARLGSGRVMLSKSHFSPKQLIHDIVTELNDEINARRHRVKASLPKRDKQFYGDEHTIRMAIENLLTNAIKYTNEKGTITIRMSYGKYLRIVVKDNGVGIPADQQSRMFKQFERIENDLSISVGGTGIGLYVVQNIADMHEGHIEVSSESGKGSTFTLVLPIVVAPEVDEV